MTCDLDELLADVARIRAAALERRRDTGTRAWNGRQGNDLFDLCAEDLTLAEPTLNQ